MSMPRSSPKAATSANDKQSDKPTDRPIYPNVQAVGRVRYQDLFKSPQLTSTEAELSDSDEEEVDVEGGSIPVSYQTSVKPK